MLDSKRIPLPESGGSGAIGAAKKAISPELPSSFQTWKAAISLYFCDFISFQ
jgi:hypothetical protein